MEITLKPFYESGNVSTDSDDFFVFSLGDLIDEDPSVIQGNNHINILPQNVILDPDVTRLVDVEINFGTSSGAISNVLFSENSIPEPSTGLLALFTGSLLLLRRRR